MDACNSYAETTERGVMKLGMYIAGGPDNI